MRAMRVKRVTREKCMARYVLCPRCELNFIDADKDEYCEVCVKELRGEKTISDDFDLEEGTEETELCPICGENYMVYGEKMCEECKKKSEYQEEDEVEEEEDIDKEDASWRSYLDDEPEDLGINIPDEEFDDEEVDEEEEEEEYTEEEFEYVSADDYNEDEDDEDDDDDDDDF